eukprot:Skav235987  [mRNA]  locus=scaffold348:92891:96249:+ [translate_table: standard]
MQVQGVVGLRNGVAEIKLTPLIRQPPSQSARPTADEVENWNIHPSRLPFSRDQLASAMTVVQKQLSLPIGVLQGEWTEAAAERLQANLAKPKKGGKRGPSLFLLVCCIGIPCLSFCSAVQEEDATVWARYSSAQFDQGAARHACNNPYNAKLEAEILDNALKAAKMNCIFYKDFLDLIAPSFSGVDDAEDMAAILARTHLIVLTDKGVYWRLAGTTADDVPFISWPENQSKDLLVNAQKPIFKAYKKDPDAHNLPPNFHEDSVWSQELLRKLLSGEEIPRTITVRGRSLFGGDCVERQEVPQLLPHAEMRSRVKQEQVTEVFRNLKRQPIRTVIDLGSPSPAKRSHSSVLATEGVPNPDSLPGMEVEADIDDSFPEVGRDDGLEREIERMMDEAAEENEA